MLLLHVAARARARDGLTIPLALCRRFAGAGGKYCNLLQGRLAACLLSAA
jgi:hypothetical protein